MTRDQRALPVWQRVVDLLAFGREEDVWSQAKGVFCYVDAVCLELSDWAARRPFHCSGNCMAIRRSITRRYTVASRPTICWSAQRTWRWFSAGRWRAVVAQMAWSYS